MSFVTFVNFDLFNAYTCRSATKAFWEIEPFSNPAFTLSIGASALAQMVIVYFGPAQKIFQTEAISLGDLFRAIAISSSVLWVDAARKKWSWGFWSAAWGRWGRDGRDKKDEGGEGEGEGLVGSESTGSLQGGGREGTTRSRLSLVGV